MMRSQELVLSDHAIARFHERVRPALEIEDAARQLVSLVELGALTLEPPRWIVMTAAGDAYLTVGDIVLPLRADCRRPGTLVATTTLVRGSITAHPRRRHKQREQHRHRRATLRAA